MNVMKNQEIIEAGKCLPRKKFYRARAHCNPLSDSHFSVYAHFPSPQFRTSLLARGQDPVCFGTSDPHFE